MDYYALNSVDSGNNTGWIFLVLGDNTGHNIIANVISI
jgi:hypothetical protein